MTQVAVLFARADSIYKTMPECDVFDINRDARTWPGGCPVIAHPPCAQWGMLRQFATVDPIVKDLAIRAVTAVQTYGGVLEHPAKSTLWAACGLPAPGRAPDRFGGYTAQVRQCDWGHKAEKLTWLYIVGCHPDDLPALPDSRGEAVALCARMADSRRIEIMGKAEREHSPPAFARWLVDLAARCVVKTEAAA